MITLTDDEKRQINTAQALVVQKELELNLLRMGVAYLWETVKEKYHLDGELTYHSGNGTLEQKAS